jgi:hypothetical protein
MLNMMSSKQKNAIEYGYSLTERLERYVETAVGVREDQVSTKRHTIIWSPPGAGKTYTVNKTVQGHSIKPIKFHGMTSMNAFAIRMACEALYNKYSPKVVWVDDCDGFFMDSEALNIMKGVLDPDRNILGWNVNMSSEIAKAEKSGNQIVADAIRHFQNGVGMEVPTDDFRFIVTTNKKLAAKKEATKSQKKMDEHAVRDRVNWRAFDITSDEAWGWMASNMLSGNVFEEDGFELDEQQTFVLLNTFYNAWDRLAANSMRTVKEAGAMLYNSPETFIDEFEQNFLE